MPPVRSRRNIRRVHAGKRRVPASSMRAASGRSRQQRYDRGYARGYAEGLRVGQAQYGVPFDGTSIIIPTYNKAELLEQCIASIEDHTPISHEIIVVDNASTDGTAAYLHRNTGKLRFHIHEHNRGFAGAVNTGLMMAKGQTICILNNDILVTPNWLNNLLNCLQSDDKIGMVGPVTNFISGEQLIEVPYQSIEDMYSFAATHNVPNAGKWQGTDRIVGFCLVFRRELFETTGYLDEGFEIGNFEDEDYVLRVRLNGRKLVIARDTFIHHFGSITMRELGDQFEIINDKNAAFFRDKWGNSFNLVQRAREANGGSGLTRCHDFYPTHVAVTGLTDTVYWVEHGTKYPLVGHIDVPIVTVSQIDLRGWPTGPAMDAGAARDKWQRQSESNGDIADGAVFTTDAGKWYQRQGEKYREIISEHALRRWQLENRVQPRTVKERDELKEGLPIIPAPVITSFHL
ncbi:glycosyltransferase family 2 protein [Paenibacillus thiaminolyticus]|uniref:glycosyltransferase family 2 protein n=1 Tax=Paenibacillus thiaminolyticus TaxID=49283 RepID=UPI002543A0D6|nr:glycosyltransferase family 2 protein [Paenibacillus thiaminolyticus]WII38866.1 glycosyltransferase family 2 protein [Paenibacillus thiaminolyticus]